MQRIPNAHAATRFFRKVLQGQGRAPVELVTDQLKRYGAARPNVMPSVEHNTPRRANNRAKVSHQPTRQRERPNLPLLKQALQHLISLTALAAA